MKKFWYNILRRIYNYIGKTLNMQMSIIPRPTLGGRKRKFTYVILGDPEFGAPRTAIAGSPQELYALLSMNLPEGQSVRILNELPPDDETKNYGKFDVNQAMGDLTNQGNWAAKGSLGAGKMIDMNADEAQLKALQAMHGGGVPQSQPQPAAPVGQPQAQQVVQQPQPPKASEPTYFKIGSIECKMVDGKVYQKQWMRVSDAELANYRLISDKNNKILPMEGKHLEVLKWTLSQDEQ